MMEDGPAPHRVTGKIPFLCTGAYAIWAKLGVRGSSSGRLETAVEALEE
jgi:hypothetical protein